MIGRLAFDFARSRQKEFRWRRRAAPIASAVATTLLIIGFSAIALFQRETARELRRTPQVALGPSSSDLYAMQTGDSVEGRQFAITWLYPATPSQPVLPPGISQPLSAGQAAVSPALDRVIQRNSEMSLRFADRVVITDEGVAAGDELFAYIGGSLHQPLSDGLVRIGSFGARTENDRTGLLAFEQSIGVDMLLGIIAATALPALIILWVGTGSGTNTRGRRLAVLRQIGASPVQLKQIAVLETLWFVLPAALACIGVSWIVFARLRVIPIIGRSVLAGDLQPKPEFVVTTLLVVSLGAAVFGWFSVDERRAGFRRAFLPRRRLASAWRLAPLGSSLIAIMVGLRFSEPAGWLVIVGFATMILAVPVIMPLLVRQIGTWLADSESFVALLAGRSLSRESIPIARSFASIASVIVIALLASAYFAVLDRDRDDARFTPLRSNIALLSWFSQQPSDAEAIARELSSSRVHFFWENEDTRALTINAECEDLQGMKLVESCLERSPYVLDQRQEESLATALFGGPVPFRLSLSPRLDHQHRLRAIVKGEDRATEDDLRNEIGAFAVKNLGPYTLDFPSARHLDQSPLVGWLRGGAVVAISALYIAGIIALMDRFVERRRRWRPLAWIGGSSSFLGRLEDLLFLLPFSVVALSSFAIGFIPCAITSANPDVQMPWRSLVAVALFVFGSGMLGLALVKSTRP